MAELIEETCPEDDFSSWPLLGMLEEGSVPPSGGREEITDPEGALERGIVRRAVSAIRSRWGLHHPCRWSMVAGDQRALGSARVSVVSPELITGATRAGADPNERSTALVVDWEGVRVVLGSDLVEGPSQGWTAVLRRSPAIVSHDGLKVPHHGSIGALHEPFLKRPARSRTPAWVVAPFASKNLPRFDNRGGIARMLQHVDRVHVTSPPREYGHQGGPPGIQRTRSQCAKIGKTAILDPPNPGFPSCYVAVSYDAAGNEAMMHGPCSFVVR